MIDGIFPLHVMSAPCWHILAKT